MCYYYSAREQSSCYLEPSHKYEFKGFRMVISESWYGNCYEMKTPVQKEDFCHQT